MRKDMIIRIRRQDPACNRKPWAFSALAIASAYALFILLRIYLFDGDASAFICAGTPATDPATAPIGLHVYTNGPSYDGQFFYRMALDPFTFDISAHGITMDSAPYRQMRVGYALTSWLVSAGNMALVPAAMITVNAGWLVILGVVGIMFATKCGNPPWWGLLPLLWPGLLVTLGRNLAEIQSATLLALTLLAAPKRPWLAAICATLAVLTRETVVLPLATMGLAALFESIRARSLRPVLSYSWLALPAAALIGWHLFLFMHHGIWPTASVGPECRAVALPPLSGLIQFIMAGLPFNATIGATGGNLVLIGYRLFSWATLSLCLALVAWLIPGMHFEKRGLPHTAAFYGAALIFLSQTSVNWSLGPSAFLRLANETAICGLFILTGKPANHTKPLAAILIPAWIVTATYAIMMP